MKKFLTLLVAVGGFATTFAQTSSDEARRVILGRQGGSTSGTGTRTSEGRDIILGKDDRRVDDNNGTRYPSGTYGSREQQIDQVNRDYDAKIQSIRNNPYLSATEKERAIRQLDSDRARRIREINGRSTTDRRYDKDRRYDRDDRDDDYKKDKKYKSNNGNHYGWEKGKGNPHKNGGHPGKSKGKGKG